MLVVVAIVGIVTCWSSIRADSDLRRFMVIPYHIVNMRGIFMVMLVQQVHLLSADRRTLWMEDIFVHMDPGDSEFPTQHVLTL
jgi:hypothetical protein